MRLIRLFPLALLAAAASAQPAFPPGPFVVKRVAVPEGDAHGHPPYHLAVPVEEADALLVLFAGMNGDAALAFRETALPYAAASRGVATVMLPTRGSIILDEAARRFANAALADAAERFGVPLDRAVGGGFSAGGLLALGYAVDSVRAPGSTVLTPRAAFSIDAPVDLRAARGQFEREVEKACSEVGVAEARYVIDLMDRTLPTAEAERRFSPFLFGAPDGGNARHLRDLPVRLYHDPAIRWQIENRCRGLMDNNVTPASELVNRLRMDGNDRAELVLADGPGHRANGERHPHTWALVEPGDLVTWALAHAGPDATGER